MLFTHTLHLLSFLTRAAFLAAALTASAQAGVPLAKTLVSPAPQPPTTEFSLASDYVGSGNFDGSADAEGDALGTGFEASYRIRLGNAWPGRCS